MDIQALYCCCKNIEQDAHFKIHMDYILMEFNHYMDIPYELDHKRIEYFKIHTGYEVEVWF
jgi:hypothetical protein